MTMMVTNKAISYLGAVYLTYIAFYNTYGSSFSLEVNTLLGHVYFLLNSSLIVCLANKLLKNSYSYFKAILGAVMWYNVILSVFLLVCLFAPVKAQDWVLDNVMSGFSVLIIFVLTILCYGRLNK